MDIIKIAENLDFIVLDLRQEAARRGRCPAARALSAVATTIEQAALVLRGFATVVFD